MCDGLDNDCDDEVDTVAADCEMFEPDCLPQNVCAMLCGVAPDVCQPGPPELPEPSLYYGFDDRFEDQVFDGGAASTDGTSIGALFEPIGVVGDAMVFDGRGTSLTAVFLPPRTYTISFWLAPFSLPEDTVSVLRLGGGAGASGVNVTPHPDASIGYTTGGEEPESVTTLQAQPICQNVWSHIAITFRAEEVQLFIDGALAATSDAATRQFGPGTAPMQLGREGPDAEVYFHGAIDEFVVWDDVFNDEQVASVFTAGGCGQGIR